MAFTRNRNWPKEYTKMKFCERYNLSPLEYERMPTTEIELWLEMANIESQYKVKNG
jgi:hypothetical protein